MENFKGFLAVDDAQRLLRQGLLHEFIAENQLLLGPRDEECSPFMGFDGT